jgi:hypothetical protein
MTEARSDADELLRSGRLVFLQTAGYSSEQIAGFGDLAMLPGEKIIELLHGKADDTIHKALGESLRKRRLQVKRLGGSRKRKRE